MSEPSPPRKRRGRLLRRGAAFMVLLAVAGYLAVQYVTGGVGDPGCKVVSGKSDGAAYEFTPEQAVNAATIAAVGTGRGLPERAVTIALATALQESGLRNIRHGDRDSLGLFQQRPSQGWGTEQEILDPTYAADIFYRHLVKIPDYTGLPLTVAAQRVQRSGFPEAYAKHELDAMLLADALTGRSAATLTCAGRAGATWASGPDAVRTALVRDFGRDALQPAAAEVGSAKVQGEGQGESKGKRKGTPSSAASVIESGGRTVLLPVTAGKGADEGRSVRERGWQLAHWAVANASDLHVERVSYAGRVWIAGNTDSRWLPTTTGGASRAESGLDAVRIVTAQ